MYSYCVQFAGTTDETRFRVFHM